MNNQKLVYLAYVNEDGSVVVQNKKFIMSDEGEWKHSLHSDTELTSLIREHLGEDAKIDLEAVENLKKLGFIEFVDISDIEKGLDRLLEIGCVSIKQKDAVLEDIAEQKIETEEKNKNDEAVLMSSLKEEETINNEEKKSEEKVGFVPPVYTEGSVGSEEVTTNTLNGEVLAEDEAEKDKEGRKKLAVFGGGLAAGAALFYGLSGLHSCEREKTDGKYLNGDEEALYQRLKDQMFNMNSRELLDSLFDDNLVNVTKRKAFIAKVEGFVKTANELCREPGNFRLSEDRENHLSFSFEEIMAVNLLLNNYSEEDIHEIFGNYALSADQIQSLAKSAWEKMSVYYMNADQPLGFANLIDNEDQRKAFARIEASVIDFNRYPSVENATNVHRAAYYFYVAPNVHEDYSRDFKFNPRSTKNLEEKATAFFATSVLEGFVARNGIVPETVEDYLITRLNDDDEKANCNGNVLSLSNGTEFVKTIRLNTGELVIDNELIDKNYSKANDNSIMGFINRTGFYDSLFKKSSLVAEMMDQSAREKVDDELVEKVSMCDIIRYASALNQNINGYQSTDSEELQKLVDVRVDYFKEHKDQKCYCVCECKCKNLWVNVNAENKIKNKNKKVVHNKKRLEIKKPLKIIKKEKTVKKEDIKPNVKEPVAPVVPTPVAPKPVVPTPVTPVKPVVPVNPGNHVTPNKPDKPVTPGKDNNNQSKQGEVITTIQQLITSQTIKNYDVKEKTSTDVYQVKEKVDKNDLTQSEVKEVEKQEDQINTQNIENNVKSGASIDAVNFVNGKNSIVTPEIKEYFKKLNIDIANESTIDQIRFIKLFNDGSLKEISKDSEVIKNSAENSAEKYVNNLKESEKDLLSKKYGSDWKKVVKDEYLKGWKSDMDKIYSDYVDNKKSGEYLEKYKEATKSYIEPVNKTDEKENNKSSSFKGDGKDNQLGNNSWTVSKKEYENSNAREVKKDVTPSGTTNKKDDQKQDNLNVVSDKKDSNNQSGIISKGQDYLNKKESNENTDNKIGLGNNGSNSNGSSNNGSSGNGSSNNGSSGNGSSNNGSSGNGSSGNGSSNNGSSNNGSSGNGSGNNGANDGGQNDVDPNDLDQSQGTGEDEIIVQPVSKELYEKSNAKEVTKNVVPSGSASSNESTKKADSNNKPNPADNKQKSDDEIKPVNKSDFESVDFNDKGGRTR